MLGGDAEPDDRGGETPSEAIEGDESGAGGEGEAPGSILSAYR
jgi:hypothetical protein